MGGGVGRGWRGVGKIPGNFPGNIDRDREGPSV